MPCKRGTCASCSGMRPAFTIIELLVAIIVLAVGALALAATAALVASHVGDGGRLTDAAHATRWVLHSLAAQPCGTLVSGAARPAGRALRWEVWRDSLGAQVRLSIVADLRRTSQKHEYRAMVPCAGE